MKTDPVAAEYKDKMLALLVALFPTAKIYLFGSRARGTHSSSSDVDIAIDNGAPIKPMRRVGEASEVLNALYLPFKVDVVDFHTVTPNMRQLIIEDGIVWKK